MTELSLIDMLLIFLGNFTVVFLLGIQSRNVMAGRHQCQQLHLREVRGKWRWASSRALNSGWLLWHRFGHLVLPKRHRKEKSWQKMTPKKLARS